MFSIQNVAENVIKKLKLAERDWKNEKDVEIIGKKHKRKKLIK